MPEHTQEPLALSNHMFGKLRAGETVIGAEASGSFRNIALVYANAGMDFVWIDMEHTLLDLDGAGAIGQLARLAGVTPLVRVPNIQAALIGRLLDNGIQGIILPLCETAEAATKLVAACGFHPRGRRGVGSTLYAHDYANVTLERHIDAQDETVIAVQIESQLGAEQAAAIAATPGIDVVILGLSDLSVSYGVPGQTRHPIVLEAAQKIIADCADRVIVGVAGVPGPAGAGEVADVAEWYERGVRFFQCFSDVWMLESACVARVAEIRTALDPRAAHSIDRVEGGNEY